MMNVSAAALHPSKAIPSATAFAALCASRAQDIVVGHLMVCEVADMLQAVADYTGLIEAIGQDETQRIMGEAFAAASLVPDLEPDLADACEAEIMLRAADLVREWEIADSRDRWRHTGEPRPIIRPDPPRRERYAPPEATVNAFKFVLSLDDPDYLARWLAAHPADAPSLYKIWKVSRC